nr:MAG TPA: Endo-N-acetylneuraminidase [Caudoviricetes sp.]
MAQYLRVNYNSNNYDIPTKTTYENDLAKKLDIGKALTNENLNNIKTDGLYYGAGSNSVTSKPSGVDAFGLKVYHVALGYIIQELTVGTSATGIKYQRWYSTSWSSWVPQPTLNAIPTTNQVAIFDGTQGRLKSSGYTIATSVPSGAVFTDTKVTQNASITTNDTYPILLGYSNATTALTNTVNKASSLKYNPSSLLLSIGNMYLNGNSENCLRYQSYNLVKFNDGNCLISDVNFNSCIFNSNSTKLTYNGGSLYPEMFTATLGTSSNMWGHLYLTVGGTINYYNGAATILGGSTTIGGQLLFTIKRTNLANLTYYMYNAFYTTSVVTLGTSNNKWGQIYSMTSTISTSDRSAKTDIHYLDENKTRTLSTDFNNTSVFTTNNILSFIENINPCTFVYKDTSGENKYSDIQSAIESNNTEYVHLGLIADDIKDEPLFNYIGATMKYIDEETKEEKITLGLKSIPLAVTALTACKYLLNEVKQLKEQIEKQTA